MSSYEFPELYINDFTSEHCIRNFKCINFRNPIYLKTIKVIEVIKRFINTETKEMDFIIKVPNYTDELIIEILRYYISIKLDYLI